MTGLNCCIYDEYFVKHITFKICFLSLQWKKHFVKKNQTLGPKKSLRFLVSVHVASDPRIVICCCYETMSNCSQNCWIDWNSATLCFKRLFHIGVGTFARFVRPLLATMLCIWEIWYTIYNIFPCWPKKYSQQKF